MSTKNGQPHGTFLVPPDVSEHDCKKHQSFYVFQNQTNCKNKSQYERLFNGEKEYDPKTHRDDRAHAKSKVTHVTFFYVEKWPKRAKIESRDSLWMKKSAKDAFQPLLHQTMDSVNR